MSGKGFIAALDQSGGSTPKALKLYGIEESTYSSEAEMFDLVHAMRTRIITSHSFTPDKILGTILFEMTMNRQIEGMGTAEYLWQKKGIVPFLKIDNGLEAEKSGVQLMKPIPELPHRLDDAIRHGVFGTKMRSVIKDYDEVAIAEVVQQQFDLAHQILAVGLVPIIEPEVDIKSSHKAECEVQLKNQLLSHLDKLKSDQRVMLKLTIPEISNHYVELVEHPRVVRVVALSGGYSREKANEELAKHEGLIASFSRALTEGLNVNQSPEEFDRILADSIESIYQASTQKAL